jgi:hypothetical protein
VRQKLRSHLRQNVVGYIALFVALGGTGAYASHLVVNSSDVVNESLLSQDVKGKVGTATTAAVNGTLTGADISGQPARPSVGQPFVEGSLTGADIKNGSLAGADLGPSALPIGRAVTKGDDSGGNTIACDPNDTTVVDCGSLTVTLTRTSRVLVVASAMWSNKLDAPSAGTCRIGVNGAPFGPDVHPGENQNNTSSFTEASVTLTNVTPPNLGPGNHTFGLACREDLGDIVFEESMVSVVVLSSA